MPDWPPFSISWTIGDDEWARTMELAAPGPGTYYDHFDRALIYFCRGTVRFLQDGRPGRPMPVVEREWEMFSATARRGYDASEVPERTWLRTGYDVSLLDLAVQLVAVPKETPHETATDDWWYHQADDTLTFRFHLCNGSVYILTNAPQDRGWMLQVGADQFIRGVHAFLKEFGRAVRERVPELAKWESLAPFQTHLR